MFGGEIAARQLLSHVAYIDDREAELNSLFDELGERGAFTACGVQGAFSRMTGLDATCNEVGSVYAEVAFQMDYLNTARILSAAEFDLLVTGLRETCLVTDMNAADVRSEFGEPSWVAGENPYYPWTFLYLCVDLRRGSVAFDFWNVVYYDEKIEKTCGRFGDVPVLRNVRIRESSFSREFVFTPIGRTITRTE